MVFPERSNVNANAACDAANVCRAEVTKACDNMDIKKIIEALEEDPKLRVPTNRRQRRTIQQHHGGVDVAEIYSPPRVTKLIEQVRSKHILPGFAFDITVVDPDDGLPWDFNLESKRSKARAKIREQKPTS